MQIYVITLMPELVRSALQFGVIGQALKDGRWALETINPREFTSDAHHTVDDRVFGGGDGMLMLAEPLAQAVEKIRETSPETRVVHLSPRGRKFDDALARSWASEGRSLTFVASRYAGVDQRFIDAYCDDEISIGDFVVSGGDLPATIVIDAVLRHRPGVLGNQASAEHDSFSVGVFESSQYTRPRDWRSHSVPAVLTLGDPQLTLAWQFLESLDSTLKRRPDLFTALSAERRAEISTRLKEVAKLIDRGQRAPTEGAKPQAARVAAVTELSKLFAGVGPRVRQALNGQGHS